jgi:hypothetical protein
VYNADLSLADLHRRISQLEKIVESLIFLSFKKSANPILIQECQGLIGDWLNDALSKKDSDSPAL